MKSIREVSFILTYRCNLSCSMCLQRPPYRNEFINRFQDLMELNDWKLVIDQLVEYRKTIQYIYLTGGEPFIVPYIYDLIKYMKKKHFIVSANSNGILLTQAIPQLLDSGIDFLILSIDGPDYIHNKIRNKKNSYSDTIQVIQHIRQCRKGIKPRIFVNCTIQEGNYMVLEDFVDELVKIGADQIFFHLQMFISKEISDKYVKQYQHLFHIAPFSQYGAIANPNIDTKELLHILQRIKGKYSNIHMLHDFTKIDIEDYFNLPEKQFRNPHMQACYAAENILEIAPDGSVITCHDFPDYIAGNVRNETIKNIWNGEKIERFRNAVRNGRLFSICHRCCMSERYAEYCNGTIKTKGAFFNEVSKN